MMIRRILFLLSGLGLLVALWPPASNLYDLTGEERLAAQGRGVVQWVHTAIRPQPQLAADTPIAPVPVAGMNTFLQWEVEVAKREETLRLLNEAGFGFIRQEFTWEDIEIHSKGDFEDRRNVAAVGVVDAWAKYDNIVDLAEQYEIEIIARLSNPPAWSRALTNTIGTLAPPDNFADYGDFVAATVGRYQGRIRYYQLWNEPNIYPEWGEQPVSPEAYTELLCEGYRRAKQADPEAVIISGAIAQTIANSDPARPNAAYYNMNDLAYLNRLYRAGAGDCFDILGAQGYGLYSGPTDQRLRPSVINIQRLLFYRDLMVQYGDAHKPIWISETGWNSLPADWPGFAQYGRVDEATKGRYAAEFLGRVQREWPWVGVVNLWYLRRPAPEEDQSYYFRLMEPDFTPLASWEVLTAEMAQLPEAQEDDGVWEMRPMLFLLSLALLFYTTLHTLAPLKEGLLPAPNAIDQ